MNDMRMAADLAQFAVNAMQTTEKAAIFLKALATLFAEYLKDEKTRKMMIDFYAGGLEEQAKLKDGEKLTLISYDIHAAYAKQLKDICERDGIKLMNVESNTFDAVMDGQGDNISTSKDSMWIYGTQQKEFHLAVAEAKARSGFEQEIPRDYAKGFVNKLIKEENPMLELKDVPIEKYIALRKDIQKLNPEMRFTLFPKYHIKNGQKVVDIGFLSKTEKLYNKKGNAYLEPKQYNIPELVKGLLYKQKVLEQLPETNKYFDQIRAREEFKQKTIEQLLRHRPQTISSLEKLIENSRLSQEDKQNLINILHRYQRDENVKDELLNELDKIKDINIKTKELLRDGINDLGKETYIISARVISDGKEIDYEADLRNSICVGADMTIRMPGRNDLIISDEKSMQNNLDRMISEFTEKGRGGDYTFIALSAKEFNELEKGNPAYMSMGNRLKKKRIRFLNEINEETLFKQNKLPEKAVETEKEADLIIDQINQKKEKFMLESDLQNEIGIDRFDEHPDAIIQEIIVEQNYEEQIDEEEQLDEDFERIELYEEKSKFEEINNLQIEKVSVDFDSYIDTMIEDVEIEEEYDLVPEEELDRKEDEEFNL